MTQPTAPGPLRGLPAPARMLLATLPGGGVATSPLLGPVYQRGIAPVMAQDQRLARDIAGSLLQDVFNPIGLPLQQRFAPDTALTATMRQIGALPDRSPGQAIDLLRHSGDTLAAWLGGGLELASDPMNVAGPGAAEFARGMQMARLARVLGLANDPLGEATGAAVRGLRNRVALRAAGREAMAGLGPAFDVAGAEAGVRQLARGRQFVDEGALGGPEQLGHLPTLPESAFNTREGGRRGNLPTRKGPALPPELGPTLPPVYGRETFTLGNPQQLADIARRLDVAPRAPQTAEDLRAAFLGLKPPPPPPVPFRGPRTPPGIPPARTEALSAPQAAPTVADLGGDVSREGVIQATANRPPRELTPTLRSLHNAVYPGGQRDFAIPSLTGVGARDFRTSWLTDHPTGNAAEQYLDYLVSRVQADTKAAARLADLDPGLAADVAALPPHPTPVKEQLRALQQRLGAGKFTPTAAGSALPTNISALAPGATKSDIPAAFDAILASGDIAAGGGGGGGLGIANIPGGAGNLWRLGSTAIGAGLGGTLGAGAGFATTDGDLKQRLDKAADAGVAGAVLGGAAGLGLSRNTTGEAAENILRHAWGQAGQGQAEAVAARATSGVMPRLRDIWPALKRARIQHPKNLLQDEAWGSTVLAGLQPGAWADLPALREDVTRRLATATKDADLLPTPTQTRRAALGLADRPLDLGMGLAQGEKKFGRQLSDIQTGIIEGAASALSPTGLATNLLGAGVGVAKGARRGWLSGLFHGINDTTNGTFRSAIYDDELASLSAGAASDFLGQLRAQGIDVSSLAPDGSFSAADVARVAGPAAGRGWQAIAERADDLAQGHARFLMGDYGKVGPVERLLGGPVPFASWVIRAYPVALALAAEHPAIALGLYQYYRATTQGEGQPGQPDYTRGMVPIPTSTPFVGPLVAALVPGNTGTVYVDPVGAVSPVSGDMFSAGEDEAGMTWYQRATKFLSRTGLPGVNPAIQTGAYLTGLDYKGPGSLTNTQGLEDALGLIPGNPALPNPTPGLLAAGRSAISPVVGPALGGQADANATAYDPITRRYGELVFEETGKALADKANRAYLAGMADPDNDLMRQARREVLLAGAAKNAVSLTSPVGAVAQTGTAQAVKAAQGAANLPSQAALAGLDPFVRAQVQRHIDATKAGQPLLTLHQGETPGARANLLLTDWERENQALKDFWPSYYQLQLLAQRERLGLERPGAVASEYRYMDQRNAGALPGGPMIGPGVPLPFDNQAGQAVRDLVRRRLGAGR